MNTFDWLSLVVVCALGAMSPGPSLAVIVHIAAQSGRRAGMAAALGHGVGIGCHALLAVTGLAAAIEHYPLIFHNLKLAGAAFLAWLGLKALGLTGRRPAAATPSTAGVALGTQGTLGHYLAIGGFTALLNPKVIVFFLALFSQFLRTDAPVLERALLLVTAVGVDTGWYLVVALLATNPRLTHLWQGRWLEKLLGVVLITVALRVIFT